MAFKHGKDTFVSINGSDISAFTNNTTFGDETDTHDTTCYGNVRKTYQSGLGDGTITISGVYDDGATGPRAVLKPLKATGAAVTFIYRPEGTGAGRAQSSVSVIVKTFNESSPVADNVTWTSELQMTGLLNETDQA